LELLNCAHLTKSVVTAEKMVHHLKPTMEKLMGTHHAIKVGDWVEVLYEYEPDTRSDGSVGTDMSIQYDDDRRATCIVSYVLDKSIEKEIDQSRITVTILMPYKDATSTSSKRLKRDSVLIENDVVPDRTYDPPDKSSIEWLESGLKSHTHEKHNDEALWKRVLSDNNCQLAAIEGMLLTLGNDFKDPRETNGSNGEFGKFVSLKKESQPSFYFENSIV
jgi:hypothetical protein